MLLQTTFTELFESFCLTGCSFSFPLCFVPFSTSLSIDFDFLQVLWHLRFSDTHPLGRSGVCVAEFCRNLAMAIILPVKVPGFLQIITIMTIFYIWMVGRQANWATDGQRKGQGKSMRIAGGWCDGSSIDGGRRMLE